MCCTSNNQAAVSILPGVILVNLFDRDWPAIMGESVPSAGSAVNGGGFSVPFFIDGEQLHPEKSFDVTNPATGKVVHQAGGATLVEAAAAVAAGAKAFETWRNSLPKKRRDIFLKAADIMEKRRDELGQYMMDETGCPRQWADFNIDVAKDMFIDVAGRLPSLEGTIPTPEDPTVGAFILREPFGVVLAIAPW